MKPDRRTRARWGVAVFVGLLSSGVTAGCTSVAEPATAPSEVVAGAPTGQAVAPPRLTEWTCTAACRRWRPVLDRLDAHRTRAYVTARPELLRRVYVPGSRVLERDRQMLRAWSSRGATVSGVRLRVLDVRPLSVRRDTVRLRVVDRMRDATARLGDGAEVRLPHDRPTERVIVLRLGGGGWRIAASR